MPLQASTGIKYNSNDDAYVVKHDMVFPFNNTALNMSRSYSGIYVNRDGIKFSTSLFELSPSFGRRGIDFNSDRLEYINVSDAGDRTRLNLRAGDFASPFLDIQHYSATTFATDFTFAIGRTGIICGRNIYDSTIPKSWQLTFEGIADVFTEYRVKGIKIVGTQQPPIADLVASATSGDAIIAINSILAAMRAHGLIAA